ncbi:sugar ABC transporter substrate-binding protein [Solihabitans fulvus]|uniref:Sugar ABC transporter substrate-binding protein n=1 Tax=Solihabitans fulvus TaxID=1892852 RepID=A0A5B2XD69_9PSEU|nr:sugar ABC transporter substrate-binding protein [Solihabitans fulvus]KAA2261116.1 sugar ABC transporter substrate-binding protein [Solihabitans fulvus]
MRRTTVLRALAAAVALTTTLAACGSGDTPASGGPTTLRFALFSSNPKQLALLNGIAADYHAGHPQVSVKFDSIPQDSYTATLTTQIAGGQAPDLAWILGGAAPDFVSSGALAPLTDTLSRNADYQYGDLLPNATKVWSGGGTLYAYPFSTSPFGVFVNTDLLAKAGQQTPAELIAAGRWDWTALASMAAATAAGTGKAGLVVRDFDYKNWYQLATVWDGWGAQAWGGDGKSCGFDKPAMASAMSFLHKAVFADKAMPGPGTTADFFAGDSAMTITQISRASLLADKFKWDLVPLPSGPAGAYGVFGQAGVGVFSSSRNVGQATDFLAFMTGPANSLKLAEFFPPPRRSQLTADTLAKANPLLSPAQLQNVVVNGITNGVPQDSHTNFAEIDQTVRAALDPLWQADADVTKVLSGVCAKIQPLLNR